MAKVFSRNGRVLSADQALVSAFNIEFSYGFGVYETVRVAKGVPFFIDQHIDRLLSSAGIIALEHAYAAESIHEYVSDLIAAEELETFNLKMLLIGAPKPEDALLLLLPLAPLFPDRKLYRDGATLTTVAYERFLPHAKTLNMLPSYLAYRAAKEKGCYDALLVSAEHGVLEGTRTNFFALRGKQLISPPAEYILEGITREAVLLVARREGFEILEQAIVLDELSSFDGLFLTSTSSKIIPIKQIDETVFPVSSPELRTLMRSFDDFLATCNGTLA